MEKKPGPVFVFRNDRAEEREAARYNSTKQKTMELLFAKIQAQLEREEEGVILLVYLFIIIHLFIVLFYPKLRNS